MHTKAVSFGAYAADRKKVILVLKKILCLLKSSPKKDVKNVIIPSQNTKTNCLRYMTGEVTDGPVVRAGVSVT